MWLRPIAISLALLCLPLAAHAQSLAASTTWINDHAKFVIQSIDLNGRLTGTYTNYGQGFGCADRAFPVTGWVDGEMIGYVIQRKNPGNCTSIQSFSGFVRDGQLLVEYTAVATEAGRTGVLGSDSYRRQ